MRLISAWSLALLAATTSSAREILTIPSWAPVSPEAPPLNSTGYRIESFGGGAYMVTDNQCNCLFLVSTNGVMVVDAPPSIGHYIAYTIGDTTDKHITHFIYSHARSEHVGSAFMFENATRIAHSISKGLLSVVPSVDELPPDVTFENEYTLSHGNQTLQLSYKGSNHRPGSISIYAPSQKVLMLVDVVFPRWAPVAYLGEAEDVPGFVRAHDEILQYSFHYFVGGYLTRSGTKADVVAQREYTNDLKTNCNDGLTPQQTAVQCNEPDIAAVLSGCCIEQNQPWLFLNESTVI